jgi:hypothetical protein
MMAALHHGHDVTLHEFHPGRHVSVQKAPAVRIGSGIADEESDLAIAYCCGYSVGCVRRGEIDGRCNALDAAFGPNLVSETREWPITSRDQDAIDAFRGYLSSEGAPCPFGGARNHSPWTIALCKSHTSPLNDRAAR